MLRPATGAMIRLIAAVLPPFDASSTARSKTKVKKVDRVLIGSCSSRLYTPIAWFTSRRLKARRAIRRSCQAKGRRTMGVPTGVREIFGSPGADTPNSRGSTVERRLYLPSMSTRVSAPPEMLYQASTHTPDRADATTISQGRHDKSEPMNSS
jgi:hypothetical protein